MLEIVLNNISLNFGNKKLLKNINLEVKTKDKIALIGPNGCGKTTLLNLITKKESPTTGEIYISKNKKIGFLSQYPDTSLSNKVVKDKIESIKESAPVAIKV